MIASSADQNNMVTVGIVEANGSTTGKTAEEYLANQQEKMKEGLEGNYAYTTTDATITFDGMNRELPASITDLTVNGAHLFICQAVAEKDGSFFNVVALGESEDGVTNTIKSFKALSE